jgi:hypothetical protein
MLFTAYDLLIPYFSRIGLEESLNNFLLRAYPANVSELVVDHDYTLLAMQKYSEGSKGFWTNIIAAAKKADKTMVEPLTAFQRGELKSFKVRKAGAKSGTTEPVANNLRMLLGE